MCDDCRCSSLLFRPVALVGAAHLTCPHLPSPAVTCPHLPIPPQVRPHLRHLTLEAQAEATSRGRDAVQLREAAKKDLDRCK